MKTGARGFAVAALVLASIFCAANLNEIAAERRRFAAGGDTPDLSGSPRRALPILLDAPHWNGRGRRAFAAPFSADRDGAARGGLTFPAS